MTADTTEPAAQEGADERERLGENKAARYNERGDVYEAQLLRALRGEFEKQRETILENAETTRLNGYGTGSVTKNARKDYLSQLLDWMAADEELAAAIAPILYALIVETGKTATSDLDLDPSMFDPTTQDVLDYYKARANKIAVDVNDETEKQLRATISQGVAAGETDDELRARVETVMGAALTYRADRIARTEVTRAQGFADVEAWKQSGLVTGKEFYAVLDERACPWCRQLDGTIVSLDTDFMSLGDVYEADGKTLNVSYDDVPYPPVHTNCRCRVLSVRVPLQDQPQ